MKTWKKLGVFNVSSYINYQNITLEPIYKITSLYLKDVYDWSGQTHLVEAHGLGRNQGGFGIFEGTF
jgi:hypothetical protein